MATQLTPVEVFCSYAHEDEAWLRKLEAHLSLLKRQGLISLWHDRLISPGMNWAHAIDSRLEAASVILLLVSADFIASDYCYGIEMKRALERQEAGEVCVIPIAVRSVDWKDAPFSHLQALPTDAIPIASWVDTDAALADVAAGLRRVIVEDLPQLTASASRASFPKIWNVPYPYNPFFLGRDKDLARIRRHLQASQAMALSQPQAISGLGGIGKTQLALEYAYRYRHDYQIVLWARADTSDALISSYVTIASLLRLPEREAKEQEVMVQAVKTWLQTHRDWLLIVDNADELAFVPTFLPPVFGGHLLLTTRATATGRWAHRLEIETLEPSQGALFLLRRAGILEPLAPLEQASSQHRELALSFSQDVGGLPLALDQAGAYLEATGGDLAGYVQLYQRLRVKLFQERREGLVSDHPDSVTTTWSLSFERVQEKNPTAAHLLRMMAFLSPDAIPEELFTGGASVLDSILAGLAEDALHFNKAIEALRSYSLIQRNAARKMLSVHRLVQAVLQDTLEDEERLRWAWRVMLMVNAAFPHAEYKTWLQCERLLPHALAIAQLIETYSLYCIESVHLLYQVASYLHARARYEQAESLYQQALRILREPLLKADDGDRAPFLNNLANLYRAQGKYEQAEPLFLDALRIWESMLGPNHLDVAHLLDRLAILYLMQGKYEQAEPLFLRALSISEYVLGSEHPTIARLFDHLGKLYLEQGNYEQAEPFYQKSLYLQEQVLKIDHPDVAYAFLGLANIYREQKKYEQAEPLYQKATSIWEKSLGQQHPETAEALHDFALFYEVQNEKQKAEELYQRAICIREQVLGKAHSKTEATRMRLAFLHDQ